MGAEVGACLPSLPVATGGGFSREIEEGAGELGAGADAFDCCGDLDVGDAAGEAGVARGRKRGVRRGVGRA